MNNFVSDKCKVQFTSHSSNSSEVQGSKLQKLSQDSFASPEASQKFYTCPAKTSTPSQKNSQTTITSSSGSSQEFSTCPIVKGNFCQ